MNYIKIYVNPDGTIRRDLQEETPIFQYSTNTKLQFISPLDPILNIIYGVVELANGVQLPAKLMAHTNITETIDGVIWRVWEWNLTSAATSYAKKNQSSPLNVSFYYEIYNAEGDLLNTQTVEKTQLSVEPTNFATVEPVDDTTAQNIQLQVNKNTVGVYTEKDRNDQQDTELANRYTKDLVYTKDVLYTKEEIDTKNNSQDNEIANRYKKSETYTNKEVDLLLAAIKQSGISISQLTSLANAVIMRDGSTTMNVEYIPENSKDVVVKDWLLEQINNLVIGQPAFNVLQFEEIEALNMSEIIEESHKHNHDDRYQRIYTGLTFVELEERELNITVDL